MSRSPADHALPMPASTDSEALAELQAQSEVSDERLAELSLTVQRQMRGLTLHPGSDEALAEALRVRRDERFEQVRQAMEESRTHSSRLLDRRLSDFERGPGATISRELPRLRQRLLDLAPEGGGLKRRLLRVVPFARGGERETLRLQSGRRQIQAVVDSLAASREQLLQDHRELDALGVQLTQSVRQLRLELLQNLVARRELQHELQRADLSAARRQVLEQHLLLPLQQEAVDLSTQLQVALQALVARQDLQDTGRQLIEAVNRASTTTVAALETGLVLAGVLQEQARVGQLVVDLAKTTEQILLDNARMIRQNAVGTATLAGRPLIRVEVLLQAAETLEEGRREVDALRANQGRELERSLTQLQTLIERSDRLLSQELPESSTTSKLR
ncbi:toxic anion resistance protein [Deinococcus sonorensis]|uniref:Toxic anion resistance protein n=2 Tax=Deinococcus sonorensis TaxID=309891 RepID=A0AAU7U4Q6_9DEIO